MTIGTNLKQKFKELKISKAWRLRVLVFLKASGTNACLKEIPIVIHTIPSHIR